MVNKSVLAFDGTSASAPALAALVPRPILRAPADRGLSRTVPTKHGEEYSKEQAFGGYDFYSMEYWCVYIYIDIYVCTDRARARERERERERRRRRDQQGRSGSE